MRCREAERWISSRIDGEAIPHGVLEGLETHIAACAGCSRFLRDEEERARALGAHLAAGNTQPLARVVMAAVRAGEASSLPEFPLPARPGRGGAPYTRPLAALAAALLVIGALVFLGPGPDVAVGPPNEVAEDAGTTLIYFHEEGIAPSEGASPLEKEVRERHQVILEPARGGARTGPLPAGREQRHFMQTQYQRFVDYRYY